MQEPSAEVTPADKAPTSPSSGDQVQQFLKELLYEEIPSGLKYAVTVPARMLLTLYALLTPMSFYDVWKKETSEKPKEEVDTEAGLRQLLELYRKSPNATVKIPVENILDAIISNLEVESGVSESTPEQ